MTNETKDRAEDQARAQVESIVAMVAALKCDYDRLEELRDEKTARVRYIAGWNMPGYMPDGEPAEFDDVDDAKRYIIEAIKRAEDEAETEEKAEMLCAFAEDVNMQNGEFSARCGDYVYWVTRDGYIPLDTDDAEELAELESAAGDNTSEEMARESIEQDALSVEVRTGWSSPGNGEELTPEEFRIVLCTGGPHVEIVGDLDRGTPARPRIIHCDWGTSGELFDFDRDAVLAYCSVFYFGE